MSRLRIVADQNMPGVETLFAAWGEVRRVEGRGLQREDLLGADVLLVRSVTRVDADLLRGTPVRFVGSGTAGLDHVDRDWLRAHDIGFAAAPGSNANAVVEYVLAVIASVADHAERLLAGGRVGVVGFGHVGRALVARLAALGIASCQHDPWLPASSMPHSVSLEEVLGCDVITLHCELTARAPWPSRHLLDGSRLARLSAGQLLINASRGPVVDNRALLERLQAADAPRCVLDVWEDEPWVDPDLLRRVLLGTPHVAGYSLEAKWAATEALALAMADFLQLPAAPGKGLPPLAPLELPPHVAGAGLWRFLMSSRYDPRDDDSALRAVVLGGETAAIATGFDALRKNYRERRELAGSDVLATSAQQREVARALGCRARLK